MMAKSIGVGITGLSPKDGWAQRSHLAALQSLKEYFLIAVANSSLDSATKAAAAFRIPSAHANVDELAHDDQVDLVSITVKVPLHKELVNSAIEAGKMVFCEWPLGNGIAEAEAMAAAAKAVGVRTMVGLQARSSPAIRYLKDLLADGFVGEVLSTTLVGSGGTWGEQVGRRDAYLFDRSNGANLFTIPFGHTIDALCHVLGEFAEVSATFGTRRKTFTVTETGEERPFDTDDQIAVTGKLESGAVVAAHYRGGMSRGTNFRWEINGTDGDLEITAPSGHIQLSPLTLRGAKGEDKEMKAIDIPERYRRVPQSLEGSAVNVAEAYRQFALEAEAAFPVPDFEAAVERHRLLEAIERAARTGSAVRL